MKNIPLFLFGILLSIPNITLACSCFNIYSFCESINHNSKVIEAEVIEKYNGNDIAAFMDIKITGILQGDVAEEMITVVNYGTSCDISFEGFEIGKKFVTKFTNLDVPIDAANFSMIRFSGCSTDFLRLTGDEIQGNIESGVSSKAYSDFKTEIGHCAELTPFDRDPEELAKHIFLFPNPTSDLVNVYSNILSPTNISLTLFSANGQLIMIFENVSLNAYDLDLSHLASGVYFLKIRYRENAIVKKIVKR